MLFENKVIEYFINNPYDEIHLRGLAKRIKTPVFTVKKYVDYAVKDNLVIEKKVGNLRMLKANMKNPAFRYLKIFRSIDKLQKSGIVEYLSKMPLVSSITLFGSVAKGEDDYKSDVDIIVIGQKVKIDLGKYEEMFGKEIAVKIYKWSEWKKIAEENKAFYQDIILYGITLLGEKPVVQ